MKRQINNTLLELITGIIISAAVVEVLSILVAGFLEIYVWAVDWSSYSDRACCPYVPLY